MMSIFSASPSICGSLSGTRVFHSSFHLLFPRVSVVSCSFSARSSRRCYSCVVYSSKVRARTELVEAKESNETSCALERLEVPSSESRVDEEVGHSRTFLNARSEEELITGIRKEVVAGRLPSDVATRMEEIYQNYSNAILQSGSSKASDIILSNIAVAFDRMLLDVEPDTMGDQLLPDPFNFSPHHKAIREPFDYYVFGQNYIRPLVDFRLSNYGLVWRSFLGSSYVGNISFFHEMAEKLQQTYVAGDRVVTEPVCKPFSMGRYDIPQLAEMKKRSNTRSLKEMALLLRTGAPIIWIAPSGGRDRPDPSSGEWYPAPFDVSSVDNMRRLLDHSGVPGHIHPVALLCHDIMPPPCEAEKEIGERRMISYHGVGLSVAPEISFSEIAVEWKNLKRRRWLFHRLYIVQFLSSTMCSNLLYMAIKDSMLQTPDVTAPGLNILAEWSEVSSPTKFLANNANTNLAQG